MTHVPIRVAPDPETMSCQAAERIVQRLRAKADLLLCTATGGTPTRTYELLVEAARVEPALTARLRVIKLDEWGGVAMDDPVTCETYLQQHLIRPLGISPDRYCAWQSNPSDPHAECERIARWLEDNGPIDLCLLGLGLNGHLGFNEPADALEPEPHVARLAPRTLEHPMLGGRPDKVRFGLTLGMADLMRSRELLLLVSGHAKAEALRDTAWGGIRTQVPASLLALHPCATVYCDRDAVSLLEGCS